MMETLIITALNGLSLGTLLFLISMGLTTIFGVMGVLNFAHGSLYMLGAYMCLQAMRLFHNFWLGLLVAPLAVGLLGMAIEVQFLRKIYDRHLTLQLLLTFAFLLILDDAVRILWGAGYHTVDPPRLLAGTLKVLGRPYPVYSLFILVLGPAVGLALWAFFYRTKVGMIVRAAAMDREMASSLGVNVPKLFTYVFFFGSWLAGLGGALAAPLRAIGPAMGEKIIIESFIVVVIGGLGSFPGAFIGAMIFGLFDAFGIHFVPRIHMAIPFILLAAVLLWRPRGLFGEEI